MKFKSNVWISEWQHADNGKPYISPFCSQPCGNVEKKALIY